MKIYLAHSSKLDFKKDLYSPLKNSELDKSHEIIYLYDQTSNPGSTWEIIKGCDLVIAEVSLPSMSEGIELGWANALKIPIICVHKNDQIASHFLSIISNDILEYTDSKEMVAVISSAINNIPLYR